MKQICISALAVLATAVSATASCLSGPASARLTAQNGIVSDPATGLDWQMCLHGQTASESGCAGPATEVSWLEADRLAEDLGWRLPTLEDLNTVLNGEGDGGRFPIPFALCQSGQIWTASPGFPVNDVAAVVELDTGLVWGTGKGVARLFVLVRGEINTEYYHSDPPKL